MKEKKKTGCLTWIGYVFIVILIMAGIGLFGSGGDDEKDEINVTTETDKNSSIEEEKENGEKYNFSIKNKKVYDGNGITIKTDGAKYNGDEVSIGIIVKNNTKSKVTVMTPSVSVNNIMTDNNQYTSYVEVSASKKGRFNISVPKNWLSEYGINNIKKFGFYFAIWKGDRLLLNTNSITVKTDKDDKEYNKLLGNKKLYSDDNISIEYIDKDGNDYNFIIKNETSAYADYTLEECSINGWAFDPGIQVFDKPIMGKSYSKFTISIDDNFIKENNISEIKKIEFKIDMATDYNASDRIDIKSKK